jgi:high-affinity Fe2+/Pb2+ permease
MSNQRGEVITGVMVIIMAVMMVFGGMHMLHREHRSEEAHEQIEHKQSRDESMRHMHDTVDEQIAVPVKVEGKE